MPRREEQLRRRAQAAGGRPGSAAELARMSRQARDLGRVELPEGVAEKVRKEAEARLGYRCGGCGERIGVGLKFRRIDVIAGEGGRPEVDVLELSACNGSGGCEYAAECREGADVIEMVEFVWLTGDAPVGGGDLDGDVQAAQDAAGGSAPEA